MKKIDLNESWFLNIYNDNQFRPYIQAVGSQGIRFLEIDDDGDLELEIDCDYEGFLTKFVPVRVVQALITAHEDYVKATTPKTD